MNFKNLKQKGFTLIEMIIVVVILGVLAIIVSRAIGNGAGSGASAAALYESSNKLASNWTLLTTQAGQSTTVASNPMVLSGKSVEDVLIGGDTNMDTAYVKYWKQAGIVPLTDIAQKDSNGYYTINSYRVALTGGGSSPISITYTGVPEEIVALVVQKHGSGVATLDAAGDSTNAVVRYSVATGGKRDLTILKPV